MSHAEAVFGAGAESSRSFAERVRGAVRLEPEAWEEIARDGGALGQAAVVVLVAAAAGALAAASAGSATAAAGSALGSFGSWLAISVLLWAAASALRHRLQLGTALRVVGFAMAPLALNALAAIPAVPVQTVVRLLALALFFAALVAGTRQALRVETLRATLVCATAGLGLLFLAMLAVTLTAPAG
ncbi:MAG TPA: YIP1 family protein [Myxococcota bacterium]|nr:YIP1 family protein [Myxococcota bacterium]